MRGRKVKIVEELCKVIYQPELSKRDQKIEGLLANVDTVETYKNIWDEIIQFHFDESKLRDFQRIESAQNQVIARSLDSELLKTQNILRKKIKKGGIQNEG